MSDCAANLCSSIAHEQNLLRSLSVIRDPSVGVNLSCITSVGNHSDGHSDSSGSQEEAHQNIQSKSERDHHNRVMHSKSKPCRSRREILDATARPFQYRAETRVLPTQEVITLPFLGHSDDNEQPVESHLKGFREDYVIGETIRSQSHMITEPTPEQATKAVSTLKKHDFAFIKRSDGSFSYAILAFRSIGTDNKINNHARYDEEMTFVMCCQGSTKVVRKRHWRKVVRLVYLPSLDEYSSNDHGLSIARNVNPPMLCQENEDNDTLIPPRMIVFAQHDFGGELSFRINLERGV